MGLCNKKMASRGAGKDKAKRGGRLSDASPIAATISSPRSGSKEPVTAAAAAQQQAARSSLVAAAATVSVPSVVGRAQNAAPTATASTPDIVPQTSGGENAPGTPKTSTEVPGNGNGGNSLKSNRLNNVENGEAACVSEESWSEKLRTATEQARQEEARSWTDKLRLQEQELAEAKRQHAELCCQLTEQRAQHERELNELRQDRSRKAVVEITNSAASVTDVAAGALETDLKPSPRPARLEDADYPQFYEMLVYRKETVEQILDPVEVVPSGAVVSQLRSRVSNGVDELTVKGMRPLDKDNDSERVDGRLQVSPCTSQPYQWIVSLLVRFPNGGGRAAYRGTGCVLNLADDDDGATVGGASLRPRRIVILTAASNLFSRRDGGAAVEVTVIPARDGVGAPFGTYSVTAGDIRIAPEYSANEDERFNYGVLLLNADAVRSFGFGYAALEDSQLSGRLVQSAGYPSDKADGTMWTRGGRVGHVDTWSFRFGGAEGRVGSGAPVWTWAIHSFVLIGLHGPARPRSENGDAAEAATTACVRLSHSVLDRVRVWLAECSR